MTEEKPMGRKKKLIGCRNLLKKILVPVELLDIVTIPMKAAIDTLNEVINDMEKEEIRGTEDTENADDTVQREETKPGVN